MDHLSAPESGAGDACRGTLATHKHPATELPPALLGPPPRDFGPLRTIYAGSQAFYAGLLRLFIGIVGGVLLALFSWAAIGRAHRAGLDAGLQVFGWGVCATVLTLVLMGVPIWLYGRANTKPLQQLLERGVACPATVTSIVRRTAVWVAVEYTHPSGSRGVAATNVRAWTSKDELAPAAVVLLDPEDVAVVGIVLPGLARGAYGLFLAR
jgi:hypothetical protein